MFKDDEAYKSAGGSALLANLTSHSAALIGHIELAKQVADLAKRRLIAEGMADAMDMVADQSVRLSEVIDHIDTAMSSAAEQSSGIRSEEHTSELQSLMRISYAVFCL